MGGGGCGAAKTCYAASRWMRPPLLKHMDCAGMQFWCLGVVFDVATKAVANEVGGVTKGVGTAYG